MDKILETLSQKFSVEELNEIKKTFESVVDEKVQEKVDAEAKVVAKKADEYCQKKINEAVKTKTDEIEKVAGNYCEEKCKAITEEAEKQVAAYKKKLEEAAQNYIAEYFDTEFKKKYGEELEAIEEKVITGLDKYLEFNINEKISPSLIKKTALSETYAPIVEGIKQLFQDEYVPMDTSGAKKIRQLKQENAEIRQTLKKQLDENMRLSELAETMGKKTLISEKISTLDPEQRVKVKKFFKDKSLNETKKDIDAYIDMIQEQTDIYENMKYEKARLFENRERPVRKTAYIEDRTKNVVADRFKPVQRTMTASERMMLGAGNLIDEE